MKIEDKINIVVPIGNVDAGCCFKWHNTIYLKTDKFYKDNNGERCWCVEIETGNVFHFGCDTKVEVLHAKVVIE